MPKKTKTRAELVAEARDTGSKHAARSASRREKALKQREKTIAKSESMKKARVEPIAPKFIAKAGVPGTAGVLVAEGDSWFDYPGNDVLSLLEDDHGYDVESVASAGDRVENMAYMEGQLDDFARAIEKVIRNGQVPRAILLSGGGNDIAGDEFEMLLDHRNSPMPGLNQKVLDGVIDQRCFFSYVTIIQAMTDLCVRKIGREVKILVHGYDYPFPDGRGFGWSWVPFLPGPWLKPGFQAKGFDKLPECRAMATQMIEQFNTMVAGLPRLKGFGHVRYVDLRGSLPTAKWWANELHPTLPGFREVADRFADTLARHTP